MQRITVTVDDQIAQELARRAVVVGVAVPTLARLIVSYWSKGKMFQDPHDTEITDQQAA